MLSDIFTIKKTSSSIDRIRLNGKSGNIPYITRTDRNNGLDSLIAEQDNYNLDNGNVITVGLDTQTAFYQPKPFYTGQNIQVFSNDNISRYSALFITPLLRRLMDKFNWGGNGATLGRLKRQTILLPVTADGQPDYAFMERYMRGIEAEKIAAYTERKRRGAPRAPRLLP